MRIFLGAPISRCGSLLLSKILWRMCRPAYGIELIPAATALQYGRSISGMISGLPISMELIPVAIALKYGRSISGMISDLPICIELISAAIALKYSLSVIGILA